MTIHKGISATRGRQKRRLLKVFSRLTVTLIAFVAIIWVIGAPGFSYVSPERDKLFQVSIYNALLAAQYDGDLTYTEVKQHGDFGLSATNRLAGEVVALKGEFYEFNSDGVPHLVDDSVTTPIATVKFFRPDKRASLNEPSSLQQLGERLDTLIPTKNAFHAIEIQGTFKSLKVRNAVQPQSKPYVPLAEVNKNVKISDFQNIKGTLVGFRSPEYVGTIIGPLYHFHFISTDRRSGGHVLDCQLLNGKVAIDTTSGLELVLPKNQEFYEADLSNPPQPM